ncbi:unnamed protein product [Clonostachys rhizophaga]|uniref:Uncharacterized protein n=1 Tax=Clonostachys rhizophaga TaxID=160324 RepID=A0A9N9UZ62_9HYPO|nr:unnamed protein product [Clonostachys rhizophaga]
MTVKEAAPEFWLYGYGLLGVLYGSPRLILVLLYPSSLSNPVTLAICGRLTVMFVLLEQIDGSPDG